MEGVKLRQDVLKILKIAKPIKSNLDFEQQRALYEIRKDNNIRIYPFDKGAGLVRIDHNSALVKIQEHFGGKTKKLNYDPTSQILHKVQNTLRKLFKLGRFTKKEYKNLYPSDAIPRRLYGVIKAHKPEKDYPMRLIVSTIGTPTYNISKYLVSLVQPTLDVNETRLKNSQQFVDAAKMWTIDANEVQVSFDIINLYPSIPIKEAIIILIEKLRNNQSFISKLTFEEIRQLLELCLSDCYFLYENDIHELEDSGPIGLALMVVIAESFLQYHESNALILARTNNIQVKSFKRYVDDIHSRFPNNEEAHQFLDLLNKQHKSIQYTMESANCNDTLNFLDISITNNKIGTYNFKIHRKNAITNVQIKPKSCHDPKILNGVFKGFVHRALRLCTSNNVDDEILFLIDVFVENGYERSVLENLVKSTKEGVNNNKRDSTGGRHLLPSTKLFVSLPWIPGISPKLRKVFKNAGYTPVFKSPQNLQNLLNAKNKPRLPTNSYPGIYKLECSCGKCYIGETGLKISSRISQHKISSNQGNGKNSAVAEHLKTCRGNFQWNSRNTLKIEVTEYNRKVREALEIQYHESTFRNGGLNRDDGDYVTTSFWKPMLQFLRQNKLT